MRITTGAASAGALASASLTPALAAEPLPPGFAGQPPLAANWDKQLNAVVDVTANLKKDAHELAEEPARERHRIYSYLLMKLITRFWKFQLNEKTSRSAPTCRRRPPAPRR